MNTNIGVKPLKLLKSSLGAFLILFCMGANAIYLELPLEYRSERIFLNCYHIFYVREEVGQGRAYLNICPMVEGQRCYVWELETSYDETIDKIKSDCEVLFR